MTKNTQKDSRTNRRSCIGLLLFIFMFSTSNINTTQAKNVGDLNHPLRVGVVLIAPIAMAKNGVYRGVAVDIWKFIAARNHWAFDFIPLSANIDSGIEKLNAGALDILIGDISTPTNKHDKIDNSRPFFMNHVGVLFHKDRLSTVGHIKAVVAHAMNPVFGGIFAIFFLYTFFFWFAERKKNPEIPDTFLKGVGSVGWDTAVFLLNGGTEILSPRTHTARIITTLWLLILLLITTTFLSSLTSTLTTKMISNKKGIESIGELKGKKIGAIKGRAGARLAKTMGTPVLVENMKELFELLSKKTVHYAIENKGSLLYYLQHHHKYIDVGIAKLFMKHNEFSFAINKKVSPFVLEKINLGILSMQNSHKATNICYRYMENTRPCSL